MNTEPDADANHGDGRDSSRRLSAYAKADSDRVSASSRTHGGRVGATSSRRLFAAAAPHDAPPSPPPLTLHHEPLEDPLGWTPWLGMTLLVGVLVFARIWEGGLAEDAAQYAAVAKRMVHTGDFISLHDGTAPYRNKPPLVFWLTAGLIHCFGEATWVGRAVSAFCGLACAWVLYRIWRPWRGVAEAALAGAALGLSLDFVRNAATGRLDAPVILCMLLAAWGYLEGAARSRRGYLLLIGLGLGLGMMVKGPIALLALLPMAMATLWARRWRWLESGWLWGGIVLGLALVLPWHWLAGLRDAEFWAVYIGREVVQRAEGGGAWIESSDKLRMLWRFLIKALPWSLLALVGAASLWCAARRRFRACMETCVWARIASGPAAHANSGESPQEHSTMGPFSRPARALGLDPEPAFARLEAVSRMRWMLVFWLTWLGVFGVAALSLPKLYFRYFLPLYPALALFAAGAVTVLAGRWAAARLAGRLPFLALVAAVGFAVVPVPRHAHDNQALEALAPTLRRMVPPKTTLVCYQTRKDVIHQLQGTIYWYVGRPARLVNSWETIRDQRPAVLLARRDLVRGQDPLAERLGGLGYRLVEQRGVLAILRHDPEE